MKEVALLMSTPMVSATWAGRKTETRRFPTPAWLALEPGDRLWVRENWFASQYLDDTKPRDIPPGFRLWYAAEHYSVRDLKRRGKARVGRFMCRWMSRLTLEVESVHVERLQDITEAGCLAEGPVVAHKPSQLDGQVMVYPDQAEPWHTATPRAWYRGLWDQLNGPGSWDQNPEVVVILFRRLWAQLGGAPQIALQRPGVDLAAQLPPARV